MTPEEDALQAQIRKARARVAKLQDQLAVIQKARRMCTPDCGRGNHDIEVIVGCGPCAYTGYVCRKCPEEEWL